MRGDDDRAVAYLHAIAVEIGAGGAGQHHARPVVAVEDERLFDRTLRQHNLFGPYAPHALARGRRGRLRQMIGEPLAQAEKILVVVADRGRKSEEHTSELQSLMRISYAVFCLKKKKQQKK